MRKLLADMAAATALLTILPVPQRWQAEAAWPRAMRATPLIGAMMGGASALGAWLAMLAGLDTLLAALLALLAGVLLTGALHEDGLADMADALGGRSRTRRLEILHDVHAGTLAILALVFAVSLQAAALATLLDRNGASASVALVAVHALSRSTMVALARWLPPARKEGMGNGVARPGIGGILLGPALALPVMFLSCGAGAAPAWALLATVMAGAGCALLARKLFGGQTGDLLGAAETISRTLILVVLAAVCPS